MSSLTKLRKLSLHWSTPVRGLFNPLWPALRDLSQLTALTTTYITEAQPRKHSLDLAEHHPLSLVKLMVLPAHYIKDAALGRVLVRCGWRHLGGLAHLTCLTGLQAPTAVMGEPDFEQWGHGYWPRATDDDDVRAVLPASLELLQLEHVQPLHMQQLVQLTKLHTLVIEKAVDLTCEQLQRLQEMEAAHGGCYANLQLRYCGQSALQAGLALPYALPT